MTKAYAEYHRNAALIRDKTEAELHKAAVKAEINITYEERVLKLREDIKLEASCLSEAFTIAEDGSVERRQEFLLKQPRKYISANFKVLAVHSLCTPSKAEPIILQLKIRLDDENLRNVYINLKHGSGRYFARKFREAGARLKLKKHERVDIYENFITTLLQVAEVNVIPETHGFYYAGNDLCYAWENMITMQEILRYAE